MRVLAGLLLCASASAMASITARAPQGNRRSLGLNRKLQAKTGRRLDMKHVDEWSNECNDYYGCYLYYMIGEIAKGMHKEIWG